MGVHGLVAGGATSLKNMFCLQLQEPDAPVEAHASVAEVALPEWAAMVLPADELEAMVQGFLGIHS